MNKTVQSIRYWSGGAGLTQTSIWALLHTEGLEPYVWSGQEGDVYHLRSLPHPRILWVAEGCLTINLPDQGQNFSLKQGDRLELPAGIPHEVAIWSERLICVEVYS